MSLYLKHDEIIENIDDISTEFQDLVSHPWLSARQNSRQWQFFKHSFAVMIGEETGDFSCSKQQATQYKFEIAERLNSYYLSFGKPLSYIFTLISEKSLKKLDQLDSTYPTNNGYSLRVSENTLNIDSAKAKRQLIEKTIGDAIDAEFAVYKSLPDLDLTSLDGIYDPLGGAYKKVCMIARGNQKRAWTLKDEFNPSTKRWLDFKLVNMTESAAEVRSKEYWLLQWYSLRNEKNEYRYKEENWQTYYLVWNEDRWLVSENIYPPPRLSTPRRSVGSNSK